MRKNHSQSTNQKTVTFLTGAGISTKAGIPTVWNLTELIKKSGDVYKHTDQSFFREKRMAKKWPGNEEYIKKIQTFLLELTALCKFYLNDKKYEPNYEELYFIVDQIRDDITGEVENPLLYFMQDWLGSCSRLLLPENEPRFEGIGFVDFIRDTKNYLTQLISNELWPKEPQYDYFQFFVDAVQDGNQLHIFTLNHDTLLERFMEEKNIDIEDGLHLYSGNMRRFDVSRFTNSNYHSTQIRYYKLHGSINWHWFKGEDNYDFLIASSKEYHHAVNISNKEYLLIDNSPVVLMGTFNKISEYSTDPFLGLFCLFKNRLAETQKLIVSGYGFGDKGINTILINWFYSKRDNQFIIIHPDKSKLIEKARGAIRQNIKIWIQDRKCTVIEKKFEDTTWSEIKTLVR